LTLAGSDSENLIVVPTGASRLNTGSSVPPEYEPDYTLRARRRNNYGPTSRGAGSSRNPGGGTTPTT
jgi:hypothetical protein